MTNGQQDTGAAGVAGECVFSVRIEGGFAHLDISMDTMNDAATAAKG
ncbi:hypothetical protein JS528_06625 [Bifidobacterium sp. MA2]|uniref:Uncharacterized protein n=1 Tax=Bifidobacterium santillanense TaxID=2809028 RepID=A0ABS5UQC6_9BIFI|nr:hypothetical protein [Bifidobacterium santillanense]MBT1173035.1 hypothetical protein [Bifidobacterium santillanense]